MRRFQFIASTLCMLFVLSVSLCSSAQTKPNREQQTWRTLLSIQKRIVAIRILALQAANNPIGTGQREQELYQKHLLEIERLCATIRYGDIYARITLRDRLNIAEMAFSGYISGEILKSTDIYFAVKQPATTAKLSIVLPTDFQLSGEVRLGSSVVPITGSPWPNYYLHYDLEAGAEEEELLTEYDRRTNTITFQQLTPGSQFKISLEDPKHLLSNTSVYEVSGTDAVAKMGYYVYSDNGSTFQEVLFQGGTQSGDNGLMLRDHDDNRITLTYAGNQESENHLVALHKNIILVPTNLGSTFIAGSNLTLINLETAVGSCNALLICDEALWQISDINEYFLKKHPGFHP